MTISLTLPIRTYSELNRREHWAKASSRHKAQQQEVYYSWPGERGKPKRVPMPCVVTFTRRGPALLDDDNLATAFKYIRDTVALMLGNADDSPSAPIRWQYQQERDSRYSVTIEVRSCVESTRPACAI